jgi:hypothetical protein
MDKSITGLFNGHTEALKWAVGMKWQDTWCETLTSKEKQLRIIPPPKPGHVTVVSCAGKRFASFMKHEDALKFVETHK